MNEKQSQVYNIIWGSGVIIALSITFHYFRFNILGYILFAYPIFLVVFALYIRPLEWIGMKTGFFERKHLYPPNTNSRVRPNLKRSKGSDCDCRSHSNNEE